MLKLWTDALFLFAVVAGLIYEFLYEPVYTLVSYCLRTIVALAAGTWRRIAGERAGSTSLPRQTLRPPGP
jgi:hypothetical protein